MFVLAAGLELTPYKSLAGILSKRFGGTADDIGGPMTEALVMASMSTRERMEHVENQLLLKHRMAVKFRRAVAEQRKQTEDMKEQELKQQSRKIVREPHPLTRLLSQKRCEYFVGLGTDPSVPQVLQFEGKVYCRTLEKAEAERTVHTIWRSKRELKKTHNINVSLADYLYIFLQKKFSKAQTLSEASYNLLYSLSKHMYDPDCSIFLKVLMNEVGEDIREQQDGLKSTFLEALKRIDEETNVKATGWLLKNDMRAGLRKSFYNKTEHQLVELFDALDSDEPRELVNYFRLFDSDNDLNQGVFAETIRQQHLNEQMAFYQSIEEAILDQVEKNGNDSCTPQMLSTAFKKTHPHMSPEEIEVYQKRVFPSKNEKDKGKKASVPLNDALSLLRTPHMPRLVDLNTALDISRNGGAARVASPTLQTLEEKEDKNTEQQEQGKEANEGAPAKEDAPVNGDAPANEENQRQG
ncbi:hypothetical protein DUNSADRAFT_2449 [Dunaliella salina]|uniref:Uncharacterized protein n=1 Tax=Dunaliella salina TaxID=3046 RepID=A0ABQ7FWA6_DUNSA|nr:hypothetical protein DUNSADRAFT_2449 [Dunaliella salina]|eukprot:KAF5826652.1 hypothetical protein DUNSADRAFT_2449 [Dunaliella salina]